MKIRNGFVSNSSSSSFIIRKENISRRQIELIRNHIEYGKKFGIAWSTEVDEWDIREDDDYIRGSTSMDNFDMVEFFRCIGIAEEHASFDGEHGW